MARVQFDVPQQFPFTTELQIYISHINAGDHLDHAQLLALVSEARTRFFRWLGYTERDVEGCRVLVGDLISQYKGEGFYGETLCISMVPGEFNKYGFDLLFQIREKLSGREVARGKTGMVFVNPDTGKVALVPEAFRQRLTEFIDTVHR